MDEETARELLVQYRENRNTKRKVSERSARGTITGLRSIGNRVPLFPYLLAAADEMEALLNEVVRYRAKEKK